MHKTTLSHAIIPLVLAALLLSGVAAAVQVDAGTIFRTSGSSTDYYVASGFNCTNLSVFAASFEINGGNSTAFPGSGWLNMSMENLCAGSGRLDFTSNVSAANITISNNFANFTVVDGLGYALRYQGNGSILISSIASSGEITFNSVPAGSWYVEYAPIPPDPVTLAHTTGNFWVHHTWDAGTGNVTDSYNVSVNSVWHNTSPAYYNDTYSAHAWQNITVFAFNTSGTGTLSAGSASQDTQIPNNLITITNTSDWSGNEGENVYVNYDATDLDSDTPVFSCNRTDLFTDFDAANGTGNWATDYTDSGTYHVDFGVSDGYGSTSNYTMTITVASGEMTPPDPVTLAHTTGNFWVHHTWSAGSGTVTDSFNISVNSVWNNGTTATANNTTYSAHAWQNITIWAYNTSGTGTLSAGSASQDTQIPNNLITITNTSDWSGNEGDNVYVNYDATDADSDTPAFSCNRTDLFTDFDTANGTGNWATDYTDSGTYHVDFGVSDGYGSTSNYTMTITVASGEMTPPDPVTLAHTTGNFWVHHTWSAGSGTVTDSFNISINSAWNNGTTATANNTTYSAHAWQNITVFAFNTSGTGTLSSGSASQDTQIPNNLITITNTSDWSGNEGENVYVNYDATDADSDTPAFSCNRTDLFTDFDAANGTGNWATDYTDSGTYHVDFGVSDGYGSTSNYTMTITVASGEMTPPDPVTLAHTTGNFWVHHTWSAGSGTVTDSFNISINSVWNNGTTATANNTTYSAHAWQNIMVFAFNSSGTGTLSSGSVSQDTQIPNNPVTITNTSDWSGDEGETVYVNYDATDADSDTPAFSCNRTDLFTDFDTANGTGNWATDYTDSGTYHVDFGVSDGYGSTSNYTMTITVASGEMTPPDPVTLAHTTGNFWVHHTWSAGSGTVTDSFNISVNSVWNNGTTATANNTTYSAHAWQNITIWAYNTSGTGTLSSGSASQDTQIPNNLITITNTSDWSGNEGDNVYVNYDATDADSDTPAFSCNRTDLFTDFDAANGTGNWATDYTDSGTYHVDFGVSDGYGSTSNYTMTITVASGEMTPPDPVTLAHTTGNFWVHHTWSAGSGTVTDSFNISINSVWTNGTTATANNTTYSAHAWQNITVFAFNSSGTGTLSSGSASQDTQIPNNPVTITNTSDWLGDEGDNVYVDYDATDLDSDTPAFSCNRTDLFTDFSAVTGIGNWTAAAGTHHIDFGVSDGYGSTDNYTMTVTGVSVQLNITLLSFTPETVYTNYTGAYNMSYGIEHNVVGLNNSSLAFLFGLNYTVDSSHSNSIRPPANNISASIAAFSQYGSIFRQFQRNVTPYLTWEFNDSITEGNVWKWGGLDHNSTRSLSINPVNATYTYVNISGSHITVHQNMHYLDAMKMFASEKTACAISKSQGGIFKMWDIDQINGRNDKYYITLYLGTGTDGAVPDSDIHIRILNSSFNPLTDDPLTSPFSTYMQSLSPTEWLDHAFSPHPNATYIRLLPINVSNLAIDLDPINYLYLYSGTVSAKPYILHVTDSDSGTNLTFGETGVAWTRALPGGATSAYAYTPNIFTTAARDYEEIDIHLYGADNNGVWAHSGIDSKSIGASQYPPSPPSFCQFEFAGYNDTSMDCTYRDNVTVWVAPGIDPDGGTVANNLSLWTANRTVCVATINTTFAGTCAVPVVFNTAPYYSTSTMYVMRCDTTDPAGSTATRWTQRNFSLSPLGTSGAFVDGSRITFWGMDDVPALYTAISDPTAISLSGSTYTFHKAFHHSQYGDVWNVSSDIRIISTNDTSTPYYRLTGTDEVNGATILSWNETIGAPAPSTEEHRAYLYSDEYYSRINIRNSNISYLGQGISPYRGIYIQNGEGCVIDNNTFLHNGYGLYISAGGNFSVTNNTVVDPVGICLDIANTNGNVSVRDNRVTSDVEAAGIRIEQGGSGNEFINNTISGLVQSALYARHISDSIFRDNTLNSVQFGITLSTGCENITITDNDIAATMDSHGNPAWGLLIMYGTNNISNNTIDAHDGYGIVVWQCDNATITNNSITTNTGTHPDAGAFADYVFESGTTGNILRNPADTSNSISIIGASNVRIENTDNTVFSTDGTNHTYAYPTNFSLFADTPERFNITQLSLTATPASDRIRLWNPVDTGTLTFNASNDTANPQAWFNVTNTAWVDANITVYRDDAEYYNSTADASGFFPFNYTGGWSEHWFEFSASNLAPGKPSLVTPSNGATGQSTNPTLQVTVTDPDLNTMDVTFYQQGGSQIGSTQTGIASGGTASVIWAGRSYNTLYYWYAVADDGNASTQSDTWHFTTQSSGGAHYITINDCNDRNTSEGGLIYNNFNYTNDDADAPVFTTNATQGSLDSGTGIFSWTTGAGDAGIYTWWFKVQNAYGNSNTCIVTFTVTHVDVGPPTNLQHTTGNFWVMHTWDAGIKTDSFNVSVNTAWHNGTTNAYWENTPMSPHGWSNISVAGYNTTSGSISTFISENTRIPNNPITITNGSDWSGDTHDIVSVNFDATDADTDTPTFSCSRMDLFTNFDTANGTGNWTATPSGIYTVDFGVTDGWGSTSNYSMRIAVGAGGIQEETKVPVSIFIALLALLFCLITYVYYAKSHISRIFTTLIAAWMAFMLSQMIVSGNVVRMVSALDSGDTWVHDTVAIQIPGLSYLLLFIAVIMSIFLVKFVIMFGLEVIREAQREDL